jgi:hypothetical protein
MQKEMHNSESVQSGGYVVQHNSGAFRKCFQLSHRGRFHDIEDTKKYKAHDKRFPCQRHCDQSHQLAGNLINYNNLRVFRSRAARHLRRGRNCDQRDRHGQHYCKRRSQQRRKRVRQSRPQQHRCRRSPSPRTRPNPPDTEKRGDQRGPPRGSAGSARDSRRDYPATVRFRRNLHDSSSESSGVLSRICSSASVTGDGIT